MTLTYLVAMMAQLFILAIIFRVILSWLPRSRALEPVAAVVDEATNPLLRPIQRRLPPFGPLDLSPLVAIFLISMIESVLLGLLAGH